MTIRRALVNGFLLLGVSLTGLGQTTFDPDLPQAPTDREGGGPRPSFLPPVSKPVKPVQPARPAAPPDEEDITGPRTMTTEVELPVPEPVAQAPDDAAAEPATTPTPTPPSSPFVAFGNDKLAPVKPPLARPSTPEVNAPAAVTNPAPADSQVPQIIFGDDRQNRTRPQPDQAPLAGRQASPAVGPNLIKPAAPEKTADPGVLMSQQRYSEVEPVAERDQDAGLAKGLGWAYYKRHNDSKAADWFKRALQWDDADYESAYGLALVYSREGDYDKAEQLARWRMEQYPAMRKVMGDIITARAIAAYKRKDYQQSRELFAQVETYRSLTRDERIVRAWDYFQAGDTTLAAQEFERLYAERPDKFAAAGVYAAYARERAWGRLEELSKTYGGPLAELYRQYVAERYYNRRLYANAYATAPEKYPELSGYTAPTMALDGYARFKSGSEGTSKLREIRSDASTVFYQNDVNRLSFDAGWNSLHAGSLQNGAFVGTPPLVGERTFRFNPRTSYDALFDARIGYQHLGTYTPSVQLGFSPAGGEISPTPVGSISLDAKPDWGEWLAEIYRSSVKQSILSYTGFRDPYTGQTWGRVSEDGINLTAYDLVSDHWGLFGQAGASVLEGENVDTNTHFRLGVALNYQVNHPDFTYLTVGPALNFEHYNKNLSQFTFGHGGYFSPDYLFQGAVAMRFMTKENRPYLVKGNLSLGLQSYKEDSAPIFPLGDSTGTYPGKSDNTYLAAADLTGMVLLTPNIALGASVGYNKTADYSEFLASAFLRIFFEPRSGLFETDLRSGY